VTTYPYLSHEMSGRATLDCKNHFRYSPLPDTSISAGLGPFENCVCVTVCRHD